MRPVVVKRFIMKDTVEERILSNRRSLSADRPNISIGIDGVGMMADEQKMVTIRSEKRRRLNGMDSASATSCQRLKLLEALFGITTTARVLRA